MGQEPERRDKPSGGRKALGRRLPVALTRARAKALDTAGKGTHMEERQKYFDEALSDFVHDAACGGAIRHLVDLGYSLPQIVRALTYPVSPEKVRKTAYRYMLESGLLLRGLEGTEAFLHIKLNRSDREAAHRLLYKKIQENGEAKTYLSCPFGKWVCQNGKGTGEERLRAELSCLNPREQDYIAGIAWDAPLLYHRMNGRMREIGAKLLLHGFSDIRYYFMETKEIVSAADEGR